MRRLALIIIVAALGATAAPAPAAERQPQPRIVGGSAASTEEFPWQAAMMDPGGRLYCGGTVIAASYVLTADHCPAAIGDKVRVGSLDRRSGGELRTIDGVRRHPLANGSADPPRYDVRVVHLDSPLPATAIIGAIATPAQQAGWSSSTAFIASGWGTVESGGSTTDFLRSVELPWVSDADCATAYGGDFRADDMVCAGDLENGGIDTCQGDSGGPLVAPAVETPETTDASDWILAGSTSWGIGCAEPDNPGVYARLGAPVIRDWLALAPPVSNGAPTLTGTPSTGELLTCAPNWSGGSAYRTYRFWRSGSAPLLRTAGTSQTYRVTQGDAGSQIWCDATASNAAATATTSASAARTVTDPAPPPPAPPAADPTPAPGPTPSVESRTAGALPAVKKATRRCTRGRRCTFTITPSATTTAIRATLRSTVRRRCGRRTCTRTTTRTLSARRGSGQFTIGLAKLTRGRHVLTLVAVDATGRRALRAYRLRFSSR